MSLHRTVDGHLGSFLFDASMNSVATDTQVYVLRLTDACLPAGMDVGVTKQASSQLSYILANSIQRDLTDLPSYQPCLSILVSAPAGTWHCPSFSFWLF